MASIASAVSQVPTRSTLTINVWDGTRQPLKSGVSVIYRVTDGNQKQLLAKEVRVSTLTVTGLPFYNNFGDKYTVLVSADGYRQAGFTPVHLSPSQPTTLDVMLIPSDPGFNFTDAPWDSIKIALPFIASGVDDSTGKQRYGDLMEDKPLALAALLNITTAMQQIFLPQGTPLGYLKQIKWDDSLAQDRFFAYCDAKLIDQVRTAAAQGEFAPEAASWLYHPGSTASWKQVQFGEANVQLTFHEGDTAVIDGTPCIVVEPDIDYYKDPAAHALLEGLPNAISKGLTNPEVVYVLRWMAGRRAGLPEFDPPYIIR